MPTAAADKLYFHAVSAAVPPGQGVHEQVADPSLYAPLWKTAPRWREALSDEWETPVKLLADEPRLYRSVGHVMRLGWQLLARDAAEAEGRIPEAHKMSFELFCVRTDASSAMNFPWMRLNPVDQLMWDAEKEELRAVAQFAKFSSSADLRATLLGTLDAELWEIVARGQKPPQRATSLERVRKALREGHTELPSGDDDSDSETESSEG